ncbi:hypothetical protein DUT91_23965 [Phyllobacterium salinisoli]|uniref:Uncharacterized protein n=1 Tax=Phyllobacterium salinisoli TaxID=1899321 RepID=A0A368K0G6_9HYPH|nr:hypothetical protein DUT91_23965 [Phyllobacterium salinisoli]
MIISRSDSIRLFRLHKTLLILYASAIILQLVVILAAPAGSLDFDLSNKTVSLWRNISPSVRGNYLYLESVKPGLGYKYALSYGVSSYISMVFISIYLLIAVLVKKSTLRMLTDFQASAFKLMTFATVCAVTVVYSVDFSPKYHSEYTSILRRLVSTEVAIIVIDIAIMGVGCGLIWIILAISKYIKFKGEHGYV